MESLEQLISALLAQFAPFAVFLASFSFIFAALGRSKIFHFERGARTVFSFALALYSSQVVLTSGWSQIVMITATAVTSGIIAVVIYHVALQRGKTKQESFEVVEE